MTEDVLTTKLCSDQTVLTLCICQLSYIAVGMGSVMGQLGKGLVEGNKLTFDYFFSYNFFFVPFFDSLYSSHICPLQTTGRAEENIS